MVELKNLDIRFHDTGHRSK